MSHVRMPPLPTSTQAPWGAPPPPPPSPLPLPAVPRFPRNVIDTTVPFSEHAATRPPIEPVKRIVNDEELRTWSRSEAFARIVAFVQVLNESVVNVRNADGGVPSQNVCKILDMLKTLNVWIDQTPPETGAQRFGNRAFRVWVELLKKNAATLLRDIFPSNTFESAVIELAPYLTGSFGDGVRIDYGSGHELSFVSFLCCLDHIGYFTEKDHRTIVTRVVVEYLNIVRRLQKTYVLEPAGSHGVWGLDDHQFLPYLWGSAQLKDHRRIKPKSILDKELVTYFASDYLFLACIKFINEVKTGPFHEHSPMLYDISGVPNWTKVNGGMIKMYVAEVLGKLPIIQHQLFGTFLPFEPFDPSTMSHSSSSLAETSSPVEAASVPIQSRQQTEQTP